MNFQRQNWLTTLHTRNEKVTKALGLSFILHRMKACTQQFKELTEPCRVGTAEYTLDEKAVKEIIAVTISMAQYCVELET